MASQPPAAPMSRLLLIYESDVCRSDLAWCADTAGQTSASGASMRSSSAIVVAQLRIVIDL
jgi:hypothetical protein